MIIAVTGGRSYSDQAKVDAVLDAIWDQCNCKLTVVHGGAPGADACANAWVMAKRAHGANVRKVVHYAEWGKFGKAAGPIRNSEMLMAHKIDLLVAFPGGDGTADCVRKARSRNIPVRAIEP